MGRFLYVETRSWDLPEIDHDRIQVEEFTGPHPAGLVGTHIHFLDPVHRNKTVWHIGLQDVIAWGHLFTTGRIMTERIVALSGPTVETPQIDPHADGGFNNGPGRR